MEPTGRRLPQRQVQPRPVSRGRRRPTRPGVDTVLVGARTTNQLETNLAAADHGLPDDAASRLDAISTPELGNPYGIFTRQMIASIVGGGRPTRRLRP